MNNFDLKSKVLEQLSTQDIFDIMYELGAGEPYYNGKDIYFLTICHSGHKHKLQFFPESKMFCCYTECGSLSLFDVIMGAKEIEFREAIKYVCKLKGISYGNNIKPKGIIRKEDIDDEINFLNSHLKSRKAPICPILPEYDPVVLNAFDKINIGEWEAEGITQDIMQYFEIKFDCCNLQAIIPHRDKEGRLIGIRGRNFLQEKIDEGKKYMPISIQKLTYRYPSGFNFYGIYQNQNNIKKMKKAIIFEGEKSVMKYGSFFGQENNIALATMGMNFTEYQKDLLLKMGVNEVVIAYDKQYLLKYTENVSNMKNYPRDSEEYKGYKEFIGYINKLIRIVNLLQEDMTVSIILCWDDRLEYKDAPVDQGIEIFKELFKERYFIDDILELKELLE